MATYSDSFTYSDGALATVSSSKWTARNNSIDVVSNQFNDGAGTSNSYSEVATTEVDFADDHEAEITVHALGSADYVGPAVRVSASGCYAVRCDGVNAAGRVVVRMDGTTLTNVGTVRVIPVNGDTVKLRAVGSTITVYVNGSLVDTVTDATFTTGQPGIYYHRGNTGVSRGDNFSATDITSGLTITSVTPSSFDDGRTGIVIAGSGFGASQGSTTLTIGAQAQTVTGWSDTSITFTSVRGSVSPGNAALKLTKG